jgi:hypothetical protein
MPHALEELHKVCKPETRSRPPAAPKTALEPGRSKRRAKPKDYELGAVLVVLGSALILLLAIGRMAGWDSFSGAW